LETQKDKIDLSAFLQIGKNQPIIDVRSPGEYNEGHIPSSINIPLFSDEERKEVGITYKTEGQQAAIKKGLSFVGPKMADMVSQAESLGHQHLLVHCWRGGMRSESVAWLLKTCGFTVNTLAGGYKSYRNGILAYFRQSLPLVVLTGYTGSMKTEILVELKKKGEQVVDFEGLANHQGSSFGKQLSSGQPTSEQYQNLLFENFRPLDLTRRIWVEDEPFKIGRVCMVEELHHQKNLAPHVFIEVSKDLRLTHLLRNYGNLSAEKLITATQDIAKKLGKAEAGQAVEWINNGHLREAAAVILSYYDRRYKKSLDAKSHLIQSRLSINTPHPDQIAEDLLSHLRS